MPVSQNNHDVGPSSGGKYGWATLIMSVVTGIVVLAQPHDEFGFPNGLLSQYSTPAAFALLWILSAAYFWSICHNRLGRTASVLVAAFSGLGYAILTNVVIIILNWFVIIMQMRQH